MSWASELPPELLCRPLGLVVLTGLDITYNAIHKAIWDAFCNNRRSDRVPLQFKVLGADHEYPKCRSKRTTYEWYIPKGIVKTSWMNKHLDQVPSLVVIFFDLDWDENMWKERQMECATKVEIVRNSLQGRSTRVAVVLIQRNAPLPPGEDVVAAERAASLCSACELSAKSLFVLPHSDHLLGYTIRLENAFYELAQSYYHTEARRVKAHKEFLNKTTHQLLFVRHQFKIAFFNELKQDTHTALKHYKQAYTNILDLRMHDTNLLEVKVISGFINYKICRLSFQHNAPLDAIAQFRKHIDFFKGKVGAPELAFEHSAWMSKQFQIFGDLFDEAIKLGLTAIQTQHPGFYYQQAANHAIARKQLCKGLCHPMAAQVDPDPLENLERLDYYGQRPWRQGHQSIDPPDALKEKDGIQALQNLEIQEDHSWKIIPLLSSAVSQFKKYKSPRMKRYLMVQMGEEYYHAKDYNKGLTLLSRVTWDYRGDRWWPLLTSVLHTSLRCAYLVANVQEYVTICMELMGKYPCTSADEKTRIEMNLIRVMSNDSPEPEPGCNAECVETAKKLWKDATVTDNPCIFTLEMQNYVPFIECKASFSEETFTADKPLILHVLLRANCQFPMRFSRLAVIFNNQAYNESCIVSTGSVGAHDQDGGDLYLEPGKVKCHTFTFMPQAGDVGKSVSVTSIVVQLGAEDKRCAILCWGGAGGDAMTTMELPLPKQRKKRLSKSGLNLSWEMVDPNPSVRIERREACMDISLVHEPPCLVNEFYLLKLLVTNREQSDLTDVMLQVGLQEGQDPTTEQSTHVSLDRPEFDGKVVVARRSGIQLGSIAKGQEVEKLVYIKCLQMATRMLYAKVSYAVTVETPEGKMTCTCQKEESLSLETLYPFEVKVKTTSLTFDQLTAVHADEPFLLVTDISITSPWPLDMETSELDLSPYVRQDGEVTESQVAGLKLTKNDQACECRCLVAPPSIQPTVPVGQYVVHWRREKDDQKIPYVSTTIPLPSVTVEHIPISVDVDLPARGFVRVKLPVTYTIHNRTPYSQELELSMETSDAFMFSGHKQLHFRVLPSSCEKVTYCLYPLLAGSVALPKLHINMLRYPGTMDDIIQKMIPSHVYIQPSGKNIQRPEVTVAT